jgi:uncharacterized protein YeaC (DUF1315 family)
MINFGERCQGKWLDGDLALSFEELHLQMEMLWQKQSV